MIEEKIGEIEKKMREEKKFELMDLKVKIGMKLMVVKKDKEEEMKMEESIEVMEKGRIMKVEKNEEVYEEKR